MKTEIKMNKRLFSLLLSLLLAISCFVAVPVTALADGDIYAAKLDYSSGGTYIQNEINLDVGVYQLDVDYSLDGSATRPYAKIQNSGGQITRNVLTESDGHYTAQFTVATAGTHNVFLAEYNISGIIYFANPVLKKVEGDELTGNNLLWDFSKQYSDAGATITTTYAWGGQWYKSSAAGNFTVAKNNTMFTPDDGNTYVAQLNYKAGDTYTYLRTEMNLTAGTYQFDIDYVIKGDTSLYAGVDNNATKISAVAENGHMTMLFTASGGAIGLKLSDANFTSANVIYLANPVLKKLEGDVPTGNNLVWDFSRQFLDVGATVTTDYGWGGRWYKSNSNANAAFTVMIDNVTFGTATSDTTAPATKMIHIDNGDGKVGYFTYLWRPAETTNILTPNTKYRFSFNWENISNAAIDGSVPLFYANYYNGTSWNNLLFKTNDLSAGAATGKALYKTNLVHGQRIDIDFTTPADCVSGSSINFVIGDAGWNINQVRVTFNMADTRLYTRDGSDNLTEIPTTDIGVNEALGTFSSTVEATTPGFIYERGGSYPRPGYLTFADISSNYFAELITDPTAPATKMVHVDNGSEKAGYFTYLWRPVETAGILAPNTKYRVSFIWENVSNAAIDGAKALFYANYYNGTSWNNLLFKTNDLSTGAATDKALYKTDLAHGQRIDIDFTTPADCASGSSICFVIGDVPWALAGTRVIFNMADTRFYTRDGSDNLTEIPTTDIGVNEALGTFSSTTETTTPGLIYERGGSYPRPGYLTFNSIPAHYFDELVADPTAPATKMIHVDNSSEKAGYFTYLWRPIETDSIVNPSTKYRVSFIWENVSNAEIDGAKDLFYANYYNGTSWNNLLFKANDLSAGAATDKALYKTDLAHGQRIDIDFTTPADCASGSSICFVIGDSAWVLQGTRVIFNMADARLYTRDEGDNLTEIPTTDIGVNEALGTFSSTTETTTPGLIYERGGSYPRPGYLTFADIPAGYFDVPVVYGDVNGDGNANIYDLVRMKKYLINNGETIVLINSDYNQDGFVNSTDFNALVQQLLAAA